MQKIIVKVDSKNINIDIFYGKEIKNILNIPIEFGEHYKLNEKLLKEDVEELIKRINILNVVYDDIYIYATGIFMELREEEKAEFLKEVKNKTKREINILSKEQELEVNKKGIEYLINKK